MSAFSVTDVEAALRYWLTTSTGLDEGHVVWSDQAGEQPAGGRFATLELASFSTVSPYDESRYQNAAVPVDGAELERHTGGPRELTVFVQAQSRVLFGPDGAFEVARNAQLGLGLLQVETRLRAAGLSVIDKGVPQRVRTLLDTRYVSRYSLDVRFNASDEAVSQLTYIQSVHGTGTVLDPGRTPIVVPYSATLP